MLLLSTPHPAERILGIPALKRLNTPNKLADRMGVICDLIDSRHDLLRPQHTRGAQMRAQSPLTDLGENRPCKRLGILPGRIGVKNTVHKPTRKQPVQRDLPRHEQGLLRQARSHAIDH